MSDYTPNLNVARSHYAASRLGETYVASLDEGMAEFDRFVARIKAEALREAGQ